MCRHKIIKIYDENIRYFGKYRKNNYRSLTEFCPLFTKYHILSSYFQIVLCLHIIWMYLYAHSSKSDRGFGDSHPSGARCLCQGVLVQCRVAHRYPSRGSFPILICVTYVMLLRWNGRIPFIERNTVLFQFENFRFSLFYHRLDQYIADIGQVT
jgi:hypothetical protein